MRFGGGIVGGVLGFLINSYHRSTNLSSISIDQGYGNRERCS